MDVGLVPQGHLDIIDDASKIEEITICLLTEGQCHPTIGYLTLNLNKLELSL